MSPSCAPQPTATLSPRVLIVDDAQDDREMYALFLSSIGGCQVTQAATGREALQAMAYHSPDVVVLDARLPDVDGAEVCHRFRHSPEHERVAVLIVTALPLQSPEVDRLIDAGPDALLLKPCPPETLLEEIRRITTQGHALRANGQRQIDRAAELRARSQRLQQRSMATHRLARDLLQQADCLSLAQRARAHYEELPGLSLTVQQAQRIWGLDEPTCRRMLDALVLEGFLVRAADNQYRRRDMAYPPA
jgi:two-component system cell cycle response regulator DivK